MAFSCDKKGHIDEMKRKLQLLEAEKTAFYESSQTTMKKNKEMIQRLRQENKGLLRKLAEANAPDDSIIKAAFKKQCIPYHNMTVKEAIETLQEKVLSKEKQLNALRHTTRTKQRHLEELKMEQNRRKEGAAECADAIARKKEEDAMRLRELENNLEKTQLKCTVAENIGTCYLKLKQHLQDESLTFQGQLDSLEAEILKRREALHKALAMNSEAQLSIKATKAELQQQEELLYKECKEREHIIASYIKKTEELKAPAEKGERRAQRKTMQPDEVSSEAQRSTTRMAGEEEKAISAYEEAFRRIKEATGIQTVEEFSERYSSQKEAQENLENMKKDNEKVLQQLKEQKELLTKQLQEMEYSHEAKVAHDQQELEEREQQLQATLRRCDGAKEQLDGLKKNLSTVQAAVEHITIKLEHITLSEGAQEAEVSPDSDEHMVTLLTQIGLKLQILRDELKEKDLAAIKKEMEEEEFYLKMEQNLPLSNIRVKLPQDQDLDLSDDEDERDEDEANFLSREELKRQSQLIIDSKSKKKH
ncbi:coiled-coil domain-containing protein 151 [Sphaeramia orbicularis]|uniref:coiled-coil domain-containing protein 151 n=1 Tax=Sphaeramia orbicularis TaxID=375764 RepID=UPI00117F4F8F|nr:coiled-coil domain-containing protein 151 [Sphaeramia orbicularis]